MVEDNKKAFTVTNLIYTLKFIKEIVCILHLPMLNADFLKFHPQLQRTSPLLFEWLACKCKRKAQSVLRHQQPPTAGSIVFSNPVTFNHG